MNRSQQIENWLDGLVYKPGWSMYVRDPDSFSGILYTAYVPTVAIVANMEDSYHPGRVVKIGMGALVPPEVETFDQFTAWLAEQLMEAEKHESQEWLRHKETGKPVKDPHRFDGVVT